MPAPGLSRSAATHAGGMAFAPPGIGSIDHVAHVIRHLDAAGSSDERHDRHVLSLHRARGAYHLADERHDLRGAALILLPAGDAGRQALRGRDVAWWCHFTGEAVRGGRGGVDLVVGDQPPRQSRLRPLTPVEDRTAGAWFRELHAAWLLGTAVGQLQCRARLFDLLALWAEGAVDAAGGQAEHYRAVIERHACAAHLSQADLAALIGGDDDRLRADFRRRFGCTPQVYRIRLRVQRARELLVHDPQPLAEIARRCGLGDAGYLCRQFRQHLGVSPREYARRCGARPGGDEQPAPRPAPQPVPRPRTRHPG